MSQQRRRGRRQRILQTPHKEVAFSQQHSQSKGRKSLNFLLLVFKSVVFSICEVVKAGPCSNINHTSLLSSFLCVLENKRKKKKETWIRLKCLLISIISQTMPTQTSALCFFPVMLCLFRRGTRQQHTNTRRLAGFDGSEGKEEEDGRIEGIFLLNVMYSKVLSACESQTHCVLQVLINSVL